ncbi:hypothetical protein NDU88_005631 [Pleurodeles waltl]|uniref:Uncharacterized protein n=1 Tax=Pleurodeles waltl TaxID=8319 RepID=A0AAV7VNW6_PLEWA|nr:hypothetical protein NDU88_005631 [Pleurodeles waltl]
MDAARRCPGGTSSSDSGHGGTSGLPDLEAPSRGGRTVVTPRAPGPLNSPGTTEGGTVNRGAEDFNNEATEEGWDDHDAGRRELHPEAAQLTGRLGGSKAQKPATL